MLHDRLTDHIEGIGQNKSHEIHASAPDFEAVYREHIKDFKKICISVCYKFPDLANDVMQDSLLSLSLQLKKSEGGVENPVAYFRTIAKNQLNQILRSKSFKGEIATDFSDFRNDSVSGMASPEKLAIQKQKLEMLRGDNRFSPNELNALFFEAEGFMGKDIAMKLKTSETNARKILLRAREKLSKFYRNKEERGDSSELKAA